MSRTLVPPLTSRIMCPRLLTFALLGSITLAACTAPAPTTDDSSTGGFDAGEYVAVHDSSTVSPICSDVNAYLLESISANRSVGSTSFENGDYCTALLYLRWVRNTDPLYTGATPDDRTYWRLSAIYEQLAAASEEHPALRMAYFDSSRVMIAEAREQMTAVGATFNPAYNALDDARFYETYAEDFPEKQDEVFDMYMEAFRMDPEVFQDAHLERLAIMAMEHHENASDAAEFIAELIPHADDPTYLQQAYDSASTPTFTTWGERLDQIMAMVAEGERDPEIIREGIAIAFNEERDTDLDILLPLYAAQNPTPELLCAIGSRELRNGEVDAGQQHIAEGVAISESNTQKRDCLYRGASSARAGGNSGVAYRMAGEALQYDANHGRSMYLRATIVANTVRGGSMEQRAVFWCFADMFNRVAATGDPAVAARARSAAAGYNRAAPSQREYFFKWSPGQRVPASHGYGSCTAIVR